MSRLRVTHYMSCITFIFIVYFFMLQTERDCDKLHIHEISLSGRQTDPKYYDVSGVHAVKMRFTSDSTVTKRGFKIEFYFFDTFH